MRVTLTIQEFGLDFQFLGFGEKVHSARGLHATVGDVAKFVKYRNRIAVFNSQATPAFREPTPGQRLSIEVTGASPFPQAKWGRHLHVNGIPVTPTIRRGESAAAGGARHNPAALFRCLA